MGFFRRTAVAQPIPQPVPVVRAGLRARGQRAVGVRAAVELLVCLLVAVLLFRTFGAEGYMISTGSMAPTLLGFHKRLTCPACQTVFPFGVAYDAEDDVASRQPETNAICPNCGMGGIHSGGVVRNHGDQLLVNKQAYLLATPRRWEVVVFRNPMRPAEAYVKRVGGLPNEEIQIRGGDLYANGELCRKPLAVQREFRMLVHDHQRGARPDGFSREHWIVIPPASGEGIAAGWKASERDFVIRGHQPDRSAAPMSGGLLAANDPLPQMEPQSGTSQVQWVAYQHWIRARGEHESKVMLAAWPNDVRSENIPPSGLKYDPVTRELSCQGALAEDVRDQLLASTTNTLFMKAVRDLYEQSHIGPITDRYGYNPPDPGIDSIPVRDITLSLRLSGIRGSGVFLVEMHDGAMAYQLHLDFDHGAARLMMGDNPRAVRTGPLPAADSEGNYHLEVSLVDQQVAVAINREEPFGPWEFQVAEGQPVSRKAIRFGSKNLSARVSQLKVFRDLYYTASRSRHAVNRPVQLGRDEYFMLGDNSPVSHDSRRWDSPAVKKSLLLGKPFLVHLPSIPGEVDIGGRRWQLRLPDWERIRILR